MKKRMKRAILSIFALILLFGMSAQAKNVDGNITDGAGGFTTNYQEKKATWYDEGSTVYTGNSISTREELKAGQHYYHDDSKEADVLNISKWVVDWKNMTCIHGAFFENSEGFNYFYGFKGYSRFCNKPLNSGWMGYCRDCGELAGYFYLDMTKEVAATIKSIKNNYGYVYICPFCTGANTVFNIQHKCDSDVSYNKYEVTYKGNGHTSGFTGISTHMYGNADKYEGKDITPDTKLTKNLYQKTGYMFAGWNTSPDGKGTSCEDEEEVINLTKENEATVSLYAQWEPISHYLDINPNGGAYDNNKGITSLYREYGSTYEVNGRIAPPPGYCVSFDSLGGNTVPSITTATTFEDWELSGHFDKETQINGFKGKFKNNIYSFLADTCEYHDELIAKYTNNTVTLPSANKDGYLFAGWYSDKKLTEESYVGAAGYKYKPSAEITLYAKWASLQLITSLPTKTDKEGNKVLYYDGTINARWFWNTPFSSMVTYEYYLSTDNTNWKRIYKNADNVDSNSNEIDKVVKYTGGVQKYDVLTSGFYTLTATGSQGGAYGSKKGGLGSTTKELLWLSKGESLTLNIGGQSGISGGNIKYSGGNGYSGASAAGGGATAITLTSPRAERNNLLSVASGGGGASIWYNGIGASGQVSAPGINNTNPSGNSNGSNTYSGGAGYYGGTNTNVLIHYHTGSRQDGGGCYGKHMVGSNRVEKPNYVAYTRSSPVMTTCSSCGKASRYGTDTVYACGGFVWKGTCPSCGAFSAGGPGYASTIVTYEPYNYYDLNCGYGQGQVINADPGFGGSSYINPFYTVNNNIAAATRNGDGYVSIQSTDNGYIDDQFLEKIPTKDIASPNAVKVDDKTAISIVGKGIDNQATIKWINPMDNGTKYYSKIEAKLVLSNAGDTLQSKAVSNICQDIVTSEVAGFHYAVDKNATTEITDSNSEYVNKGDGTTEISIGLLQNEKQWLHITTTDNAGNKSKTVHFEIPTGSELEPESPSEWDIYTTAITKVEGTNGNVLLKDFTSNTWFVRADGITPYRLSYTGYTNTISSKKWQVNLNNFKTSANVGKQTYSVKTPNSEFTNEAIVFNSGFEKKYGAETPLYLLDNAYTTTTRENGIKNLTINQAFTTSKDYNGMLLNVQPEAGAYQIDEWGDDVSAYSIDGINHAINIIPDGQGPFISGLEELNDIGDIDFDKIIESGEKLEYTVSASDELSGVASLTVEVTNLDNGAEWTNATAGNPIILDITDGSLLFKGSFSIKVTSIDKVGNITTSVYNPYECSLSAELKRILTPRDTELQTGESATIYMKSTGYVDTFKLIFSVPVTPDHEAKYDHYDFSYNYIEKNDAAVIDKYKKTREYVITYDYKNLGTYDEPLLKEGIVSPEVDFMIPLYTPEGNYSVTIKAFKEGREISILERKLNFQVIGTVLDDFRTRIRTAH